MAIPRLIHQFWIGDKPRPEKLMNTWRDKNTSCVYMLWTDKNLQWFPFRNIEQRELTKELSGKTDIMRYEILHKFGGICIDADTECTNELDDFFFENKRFTCFEDEECRIEGMEGLVTPSFTGWEPNDPLLGLVIQEIGKMKVIDKSAWIQTGERFLTDLIAKWHSQFPMKIYPSWYFIPNKPHGREYKGTDKTYARHYFGSTFDLYGKTLE